MIDAGEVKLPSMVGQEVACGVWLLTEPVPIPGTNKLRALAQVGSAIGLVELNIKFGVPKKQ